MAPVEGFGPLVDAEWLATHLEDVRSGDIALCDVRWYLDGRSGRAAYDAGHLPGAVFVDLDRDLAGPPGGTAGRHPLPDPVSFAAAMGHLGIGDPTIVVAYDDTGGSTASRLVWMLRVLGRRAALLDGGMAGWSGPLSTDPAAPASATFTPMDWPADAIVDADGIAAALGDRRAVVLDARAGSGIAARSNPWTPVPVTSRVRTTSPGPARSIRRRVASAPRPISGPNSPRSASAPAPR